MERFLRLSLNLSTSAGPSPAALGRGARDSCGGSALHRWPAVGALARFFNLRLN
jgi:hypothetical protein